jgi:hypothetical protein
MRMPSLLFTTLSLSLALAPAAQAKKPVNPELAIARQEMRAAKIEAAAAAGSEVGDADSFGRNVRFIGTMQSGQVTLASDCTPDPSAPPGPDDHCYVAAPAPLLTSFHATDVARVVIPARSAHSLICHWQTPFVVYSFSNTTGAYQPNARFSVTPNYTIQNTVLDDPALIDPATGLPYGGQFQVGLAGIRDARSLQAGEHQTERDNATRVCLGGIVSRQMLLGMGLSDAQATEFFKRDTVITMDLVGQGQLVDFASILYGVRFVAD